MNFKSPSSLPKFERELLGSSEDIHPVTFAALRRLAFPSLSPLSPSNWPEMHPHPSLAGWLAFTARYHLTELIDTVGRDTGGGGRGPLINDHRRVHHAC